MIPIKRNTKNQLKTICEIEGRTYDSLITAFINRYWKEGR